MFLILKDTDWKEEDYIKHNIVPFGWMEDNNRAIPSKDEIFAKVQTEEQRNFLLEKLNNKYIYSDTYFPCIKTLSYLGKRE